MASQLEQLKAMTVVVADTADFETMREYRPQDATTNPSLVLQACGKEQYAAILSAAIEAAKADGFTGDDLVEEVMDRVLVGFGVEILKIVPGRVSTEVDAKLSFDTEKSVAKARKLCDLYKKAGIDVSKQVLIKLASTWEGIRAAKMLEAEGIHCNLTLLFSFTQAVACGEAGVTLISPFVGRILDWHKAKYPDQDFAGAADPGVQSVGRIYSYYKKAGFKTIVMGASFRNIGEIRELAGVDALTISPALLKELAASNDPLPRKLEPETASKGCADEVAAAALTEESFRTGHSADAMGSEKLEEGIRKFADDGDKLRTLIKELAAKA